MPKANLNSALKRLRGSMDGWVYKETPHGPVIARRPDMSRVQWSPAQIAHRKRLQEAAAHYREVMADPERAAQAKARAKKDRVPVSALVMGEYMRGEGGR